MHAISCMLVNLQYSRRVSRGGGPKGPGPPLEIEKQKKKKKVINAHIKLFH